MTEISQRSSSRIQNPSYRDLTRLFQVIELKRVSRSGAYHRVSTFSRRFQKSLIVAGKMTGSLRDSCLDKGGCVQESYHLNLLMESSRSIILSSCLILAHLVVHSVKFLIHRPKIFGYHIINAMKLAPQRSAMRFEELFNASLVILYTDCVP